MPEMRKMGMTDKLLGMSIEECDENARQESEAYYSQMEEEDLEAQIAKEEADEEILGEAKREKAKELDGLIVDTRDQLGPDTFEMEQMNTFIPRAYWADIKHPNSIAIKMQVNRFISASNWRRE